MRRPWKLGFVGFLAAGCVGLGGPPTGKYQLAYEDAMSIGHAPVGDAMALQSAYNSVRTCYDGGGSDFNLLRNSYYDNSVTTSQGEKTVKQMSTECRLLLLTLDAKQADGCGAKMVTFSADVTGAGAWTKPAYSLPDPNEYHPIACDKISESAAAGELEVLAGPIKDACKDATALAFPGDWEYSKNQLGVAVHREATVTCFFKGKRDDWDLYTGSKMR